MGIRLLCQETPPLLTCTHLHITVSPLLHVTISLESSGTPGIATRGLVQGAVVILLTLVQERELARALGSRACLERTWSIIYVLK